MKYFQIDKWSTWRKPFVTFIDEETHFKVGSEITFNEFDIVTVMKIDGLAVNVHHFGVGYGVMTRPLLCCADPTIIQGNWMNDDLKLLRFV